MTKPGDILLQVEGLKTHIPTPEGLVKAVDGVDLTVRAGRTLCVVGESGSGKSMIARSILQIVPKPGRIVAGSIHLHRKDGVLDLATLNPRGREIRSIRGREIAMIFQEPMTSLSPVHTIGNQIIEKIRLHFTVGEAEAKDRAVAMLSRVGIPKPSTRMAQYPFQLSGGRRQRAMIAMALACQPRLLIADEPTTALDVTTQATILDLIGDLQDEFGMAVLFITHDLGVVAEVADDVVVMYLGEVAECGDVHSLFAEPKHPYTEALLQAIPAFGPQGRGRLAQIPGMVPHPFDRPSGCGFHPRCHRAIADVCPHTRPPQVALGPGREVRCVLHQSPGTPETGGVVA